MRIWYLNYLLLIGICLATVMVKGQNGNPFDLEHKVPGNEIWDTEVVIDLPEVEKKEDTLEIAVDNEDLDPAFSNTQIEGNPFDIGVSGNAVDEIKVQPLPKRKPNPIITEVAKSKITQFKIGISIVLMVAMALISTLLRHVIVKVIEGFRSDNLLRTYFRNIGRRVSLPILLLEIFFVVNAAFACFLFFERINLIQERPLIEFLKILLAVSVVVFGKHLVHFIIKEVFPFKKEMAEYNFTITSFFSILGLILMPCNLILAFAPGTMANIALYFIGIVTVLTIGYLAIRALLIGSKFLSTNRFHFFMYLCTVEIAPLFILIKAIKNYLGS